MKGVSCVQHWGLIRDSQSDGGVLRMGSHGGSAGAQCLQSVPCGHAQSARALHGSEPLVALLHGPPPLQSTLAAAERSPHPH